MGYHQALYKNLKMYKCFYIVMQSLVMEYVAY